MRKSVRFTFGGLHTEAVNNETGEREDKDCIPEITYYAELTNDGRLTTQIRSGPEIVYSSDSFSAQVDGKANGNMGAWAVLVLFDKLAKTHMKEIARHSGEHLRDMLRPDPVFGDPSVKAETRGLSIMDVLKQWTETVNGEGTEGRNEPPF